MIEDTYTPEQIASITHFVDIQTPPTGLTGVTACFLFGTNQITPVDIVARRYHEGLAPFIIVTGGVNRHTGVIEGQEFRRLLIERGVEAAAIRCEDQSANTWQNVELALPYLQEALALGLPITTISKWYHRRAIHSLGTLLSDVNQFHAIGFDPIYSQVPIMRENWISHPDGRRRVLREWQEVSRRISDRSYVGLDRTGDSWRNESVPPESS